MSEQTQISEDAPLHSFSKVLRDWVFVVVLALGAALLVRVYVLQQFYISGPSMETTLLGNNRVLVNKLSYRLHSIRRGDVVVFDRVTTSDGSVAHDDLIKRVIALSRDTIEIKDCKVFVNNAHSSDQKFPRQTRWYPFWLRCEKQISQPRGDY